MLWGSGISAYQAEGDNVNSDWWVYDKGKSAKASYFWYKWKDDIELLKQLGQNAFRFSFEWSRIYKSENEIDYSALDTYRKIVDKLLEYNIEPIVTLWHFSNPIWFYNKGGWLRKENIGYFLDFVELISKYFQDIRYFIILNEPNVYSFKSYVEGSWPPCEKSIKKALITLNNLSKAYIKAYQILKNSKRLLSVAQNLVIFRPYKLYNPINVISSFLNDKLYNFLFLDKVKKYLDFIGINYYTRVFVKFFSNFVYKKDRDKNCLGWEVYPKGIYIITKLVYRKYKKPIMITENGICTNNDFQRINFIKEHVEYIKKCIKEGIKIIGYIYWAFLDNYEWAEGFGPRFGLIEVDYETGNRKIRNSAYFYRELIYNEKR
ncbi:MAG: family 1 glycosylhydrolase [candidate division WOR-3 bacterium]|nr:family 1 glycosylhydrolase [candidate division WOR-3 bacterium]MCX7946968.1 family 1 glycosylhydrolase [candidate division WOR-3 bacterium]MDW8149991.1 family 1 glycosylhydrolase [candidate division WOR-3 bacterium]